MDIFEAIREDHQTQRTLADLLARTHGDSEGRDELFGRLKRELEVHAKVEERNFYVPLMSDDLTQEKSRHSIAEHHEIDELVEELADTDYSSPGWIATAKKLKDKVLHHLEEEEREVFQLAGKVLTEGQKTELAEAFRSERNQAMEEARA